jgi:hypothetical protein
MRRRADDSGWRESLPWTDVLLIDDNLDLIAPDVLDGVERTMGRSLPADYRAIMGTFGVGTYCGFIYFWHPSEIPRRTEYSRRIWVEYSHFFWPQSDSVLPLDLALQSFVLAITLDGDEIIFCPPAQNNLFVLPRHEEVIRRMPSGLSDPLVWEGGEPDPETNRLRYFEPAKCRGHVELFTSRTDLTIDSIYQQILPRLSPHAEPVPKIDGESYRIALFKSERSIVQLTTAGGTDRRIGIRIDYNLGQASAVEALVAELISTGFREIGRSPSTSG